MDSTYKKFYNVSNSPIKGMVIHSTGISQTEPNHTWGPGIRPYYLLHYILSGKGTYFYNRSEYHLSSGDLFLSFPGEIIKYSADQDDPWKYCWVSFSGYDIADILKLTDFSKKQSVLHIEDPKIPETIVSIFSGYSKEEAEYFNMLSNLNRLFFLLTGHAQKKALNSHSIYLERAVSCMENSYTDADLSVSEIAKSVNVSENYLYRLFKNVYSMSPVEYLIGMRIRNACAIMQKAPDVPINIIANSVGYSDALYFSRAFKKVMKITPSEYRIKCPR